MATSTISLMAFLIGALFSLDAEAQSASIADCSLFEAGPNATWTHVITLTTADDPSSAEAQTLSINVSNLPEAGANYRVVKTVANGNWFQATAQPLSEGDNSITVAGVSFARSVKIQFTSGDVQFDFLSVNGEEQDTCYAATVDPGTPISECNLFVPGPNDSWPHVLNATTPDDPNSSAAQSLVLNVASLPEGGANYRVVKTVANGNWNNGNAQPLALGENSITVSAVAFARSVKFQFSSGDVGLSALALNGADLICGAGCTDDSACNYDGSATADDGSCTYPASELVDCDDSCLAAVDCAGVCGGDAALDDCGVCGGDGSSCALNENLVDTEWKLYPGAGALGVGPAQGDIGWWSSSEADVQARACLFDDIYRFNADGTFQNVLGDDTWIEGWQAGFDGCGAPVAPHDGSAAATWASDGSSIVLSGIGAYLGIPKPFNGGELGNPADAPASITYEITSLSADGMTLDLNFGPGYWRFEFVPVGTELTTYDLTLEVNTANIEVGANGMYAGGGILGDAQAVALADDDGDGIWSGSLSLPEGTSGNYIFLNSPNDGGDWGAKENLEGLECSDPANYNDRILAPLTGNTTISTCFGQCSTDGSCAAPPASYDVTFQVDMSQYEGTFGTVNLNGNFTGWCGSCVAMSDNNGDGIYDVTVELSAGQIEYKFTVDGWTAQEEFAGGESCTLTSGGFTNRVYDVMEEATLPVVCWNSCEACPSIADPGTPISECNLFVPGPNDSWPHVLNATTPDDPNSSAAQSLVLNVASLPEGGANYRVVKTVANGNWNNGNAQPLALGENSITVSAVAFARSVKFQFSSGDVGLSALALNGADLICGAGCTDDSACNYDGSATADDGSCTYPASELVDCDDSCLAAVDCAGVCGGDAALDDCGVCGGDGSSCAQANVTFHVDMNLYGDLGESTVFVNGSFNGWCGACNPMSDPEGDGIWSVTLPLDPGTIEYKFTVDGWTNQENFSGGESCTSTIDSYTNRTLTFDADTDLDVVCWGSCEACPDEVIYHDLTLEVNTANVEVGPNGMYAGGGVLGDAQAVALADDDADGIWSATISVLEGTSGNYIFLNSPNDGGDWGAKENLEGLECSDPANYNDRILAPVLAPTTISTCFGQCSTDGSCAAPPASYDVTFQVDMSQYEGTFGTVNLNGNFTGWCGSCVAMSDNNGDGIYDVTVELSAGQIEYKFTVDGWTAQEEFAGGESCTLTSGGFTNRVYDVMEEATLPVVCWNSCDACPAIEDVLGCMDSSANNYNEEATADNGSCLYNTTFNVDMGCAGVDFYEVFVTGPLWGWPANSGFNQLLDADGDGIYSVTIETPAGDVEYKYAVDGWADQENLIDDMQNGASCAPVTDYNGYANRLAASGSSTSDTYGSCDACPEDVLGCTDAAACNYNADATLDDGSCEAADDLTGCGDTCLDGGVLYEFNISDVYSDGMCCAYGEGSYSIVVDGEVIATGGDFGASATERFCAPAEACVQIVMVADNYPSEQSWSVTADGVEVLGAGLNGATATYFLGGCLPGCTNEAACNYDGSANVDDDSCLELDACGECGGSGVDTDGDGVCDAEEIAGCQDEAACNYNPAATDPVPASGLNISLSSGSWPSEISWTLDGESYGAPFDGLIELAPGMYTLEGADSYGDGWNGAQMTIVDAASGASASFSVSGSSGSIEVEVTGAEGCTYAPEFYQCDGETCVNDADGDGVCDELEIDGCVVPTACNYNINATNLVPCIYPEPGYNCDGTCAGDVDGDGICDDNEIAGCQDTTACNFDAAATDAGECDYESCLGCTDDAACNYDAAATQEDGSCDYCSCANNGAGGQNGFGLSVETHVEGGISGNTTYRVYVTTPNESDFVSAITGDENNPSFLRTSTSFFQQGLGGLTADMINPLLFGAFPELAYDSWLTIGVDQAPTPGDGNGPVTIVQAEGDTWVSEFESGQNLEINSFFGGSWFTTNMDANGVAGEDKKVLVAQLTTDGTITGQLYVQVFPEGVGENAEYLTLTFGNSACGCTDAEACNYNEGAQHDDGSCTYAEDLLDCTGSCLNDSDGDGVCDELEVAGCDDELACNFNETATDNDGSCTYPVEFYDCAGNCINDADGDGVCDELEVQGCQDEEACNYDEEATDNPESGLLISLTAGSWASEISWTLNGETYSAPYEGNFNLEAGIYTIEGADSYGDGWNGAVMTIVDVASGSAIDFAVEGSQGSIDVTVTEGSGCIYADESTCSFCTEEGGVELLDEDGDGICDADEVAGCQDPEADNYNPDATDSAAQSGLLISLNAGSWPSEISWSVDGTSGGAPFDGFVPLAEGVYVVEGFDSYGDGWNGATMILTDAVSGLADTLVVEGSAGSIEVQVTASSDACYYLGCTDSDACNYDLSSTVDDGSCEYVEPTLLPGGGASCDLLFSGYAEGSSNNKFLEIFNPTGADISLDGYAYPNVSNAPSVPGEYEYWNEFDAGAVVAAGDVYVIAHPSADQAILDEADETFNFLSNGDDGFMLVKGSPEDFVQIDAIGDWNGDPGSGWEVAGVANGTKDHSLIRKSDISSGNGGDWIASAGTNADDSEWIVLDQNDWTGLGSHDFTGSCGGGTYAVVYDCDGVCLSDVDGDGVCDELEIAGCTDDGACNYNSEATDDDTSCEYLTCAGCTDAEACNFDGDATIEDGTCDYAEEFLDCDGNCLNDANINGICDELEVLGCTYAAACNYNMNANVDDGQCDFSCIPMGCQGPDVVQGCTVPEASNYDAFATCDNGSCTFSAACAADLDDDGLVNMGDLLEFLSLFGQECE